MIGICVPVVSRWGLDDLLETHKMTKYLERDLKSRNVVFNEYGQPVHPDTGRKSVRICCRWAEEAKARSTVHLYFEFHCNARWPFLRVAEFFLNLMFFFIYPFGMLCHSCKNPRCSSQSANAGQSKVKENTKFDKILSLWFLLYIHKSRI